MFHVYPSKWFLIMRRNPFLIVAHLMLYGSVLLSVCIGVLDPTSQHHINGLNAESLNGKASVLWLAALAILGAVDTIGYDLAGSRKWPFITLRRYRFALPLILTWGLMSLILQNAQWGSIGAAAWKYGYDAMWALALAIIDLWTRRRQ